MDATSALFFSILRSGLRGRRAPVEAPLTAGQWDELYHLAQIHHMEPILLQALHGTPALDPGVTAGARSGVRRQVMLQAIRTAEFRELARRLEDAGIPFLVVKGIVCRQLWPDPDHRPSGDEDLLIDPAQYEACHRILTDFGMTTTEPDPASVYEVPYRKAGSPLYIELHKSLFPPESEAYGDWNGFFADPFGPAIHVEVQGQQLPTMHPTDHMTYLLLHAFKHFLHSGFGVRQVCDILLFAERYGGLIDWERVHGSCRAVRAEKFAAGIFRIGQRHLGFAPLGGWPDLDEGPLLEDILCAGVYGRAEASRQHSSAITLEAVSSGKQARRAKNPLLLSAFPPANALEGRYPWLKGRHFLLPAAWACRMYGYLREKRSGESTAALKLGSERIELLRQYGVVD